jgi:phage baseplate assembly protein W
MAQFQGFSFPFRKGMASFPEAAQDADLIKQSLVQLILTGRGERIMRPDVGSGAYAFVFENNDLILAQAIQIEVTNVVQKYEPRVILQNVDVQVGDPTDASQDSSIVVLVNYVVVSTRQPDQLTISFSGGAGS